MVVTTGARSCPSCHTVLPDEAAFCFRCGSATPVSLDRATGVITGEPRAEGTASTGSTASTESDEAAQRARLQKALGDDYIVGGLLGRGGFAEVYLAFERRLKRNIAVKILRSDLVVNDALLERFQREAEAVAKLRHPNVVPIYAVGKGGAGADDVVYFTMPLIEGRSLAEHLADGEQISLEESCRILREAAMALNAAHRAGLVHRDVKPENIMLDGPERSVIVMDFGVAKSENAQASNLTGTGMLIGTPHYMSPEQATGERALDARSDQYALALVGYRLLTGGFPYEGDSLQALIFKTVTETPRPVAELAPDVPVAVSDVLAKAMAKAPDDRFATMGDFAEALARAAAPGAARDGHRRRWPDMATRVRETLASMPRLTSPIILLGVVGTIVAAVLYPRLVVPSILPYASTRDDAAFAAKSFVAARGATAQVDEVQFVKGDSTFDFLRRALGDAGANRHAAQDVPVWGWGVALASSSGRWAVQVDDSNHVRSFTRLVPDSARFAAATPEVARQAAARELAARGWTPAAVVALPDSTITRRARTDRVFRWRVRSATIPWRGRDSGYVQLSATVAGPEVLSFRDSFVFPESYAGDVKPSALRQTVATIGGVGLVLLLCATLYLAVKRSREDELQWNTMVRVLIVVAILSVGMGFEALRTTWSDGSASSIVVALIGDVLLLVVVGVPSLALGGVAESLGYERDPRLVVGVRDLARGTWRIPELVRGVVVGYAIGGLFMGARAVVRFVEYRFAPWLAPPTVPGFVAPRPALAAFQSVGSAIAIAFGVLFVVLCLARLPRLRQAAPFVAALLFALPAVNEPSPMNAVLNALQLLVVAWAVTRYDVIAGIAAMIVIGSLADVVTLAASGPAQLGAAAVNAALLLLPLAAAAVAYRSVAAAPTGAPMRTATVQP